MLTKTFVVTFLPNFFIAIVNVAAAFVAIVSRSSLFFFPSILPYSIYLSIDPFPLFVFPVLHVSSHFFILHLSILVCNYFIMKWLEKNVNPIGYLLQIQNIIAKNTRLNAYALHRIVGQ